VRGLSHRWLESLCRAQELPVAPCHRHAEFSEALMKVEGIIVCGRVVLCLVRGRTPYGSC
jgi:hypothetical protein